MLPCCLHLRLPSSFLSQEWSLPCGSTASSVNSTPVSEAEGATQVTLPPILGLSQHNKNGSNSNDFKSESECSLQYFSQLPYCCPDIPVPDGCVVPHRLHCASLSSTCISTHHFRIPCSYHCFAPPLRRDKPQLNLLASAAATPYTLCAPTAPPP